MKKFRNHFERRIAVDWMHRQGARVSAAIFKYFISGAVFRQVVVYKNRKLASGLIYTWKWASAVNKLISLTADAHFGARLGAFFIAPDF